VTQHHNTVQYSATLHNTLIIVQYSALGDLFALGGAFAGAGQSSYPPSLAVTSVTYEGRSDLTRAPFSLSLCYPNIGVARILIPG
jgi:hypothetical protein